jgi:hypothetical protein
MKISNKRKLEKLRKSNLKDEQYSQVIIYNPRSPLPNIQKKGYYLLLPDNNR